MSGEYRLSCGNVTLGTECEQLSHKVLKASITDG